MTKSQYLCPVCKRPLSVDRGIYEEGDWMLYCAFTTCGNMAGGDAANEGENGPTEKEAYDKLVRMIKWEQEAK